MPIYVNGKKMNLKAVSFDEFVEKVYEMVENKNIDIYIENSDREEMINFYLNDMDYEGAVEYYEMKANNWEKIF